MDKTALVFGGSGLVGKYLLHELETGNNYSKIVSFVRRLGNYSSDKVEEVVIDFDDLKSWKNKLAGDTVFICLGTTIKKAGSVEVMEQIDRDLPIKIAQLCYGAGVKKVAAVSSIGANAKSRNYYLRIKGEMEKGLRQLDFKNIVIARPSVILGDRQEKRLSENIGKIAVWILGVFLFGRFKKYRGIHARTIARAILNAFRQDLQEIVYESDELEKLGKS